MIDDQDEVSPRTLSRLFGTILLGGIVVFLLSPPWMLSIGKTDLVIQGPPGDKYTVHLTSQKPINFEKLGDCLPEPAGWNISDATYLTGDAEYLDPSEKKLTIYRKRDSIVHLLLIRSSKMDQLHNPSICYRFQGYEVLYEEPIQLEFPYGNDFFKFYANEIWTQNQRTLEYRETIHFFIRHGINTGVQDTYFVRIESLGKPRDEAREICDRFASDLLNNLVKFKDAPKNMESGLFISNLLDYSPAAVFLVVVAIIFIIIAFFWFPEPESN